MSPWGSPHSPMRSPAATAGATGARRKGTHGGRTRPGTSRRVPRAARSRPRLRPLLRAPTCGRRWAPRRAHPPEEGGARARLTSPTPGGGVWARLWMAGLAARRGRLAGPGAATVRATRLGGGRAELPQAAAPDPQPGAAGGGAARGRRFACRPAARPRIMAGGAAVHRREHGVRARHRVHRRAPLAGSGDNARDCRPRRTQ